MIYKKKLIEVALPLDAINKAAKEEKAVPRRGHPQTLHYWWSRKPLAVARAVIFSQIVDDPSEHPDIFRTEEDQEEERQRLFRIIEDIVQWENTTNEKVLQQARDEIWKSWRYTCADNVNHPQVNDLFNPNILPAFHDPFAGGGTHSLEAQRLGMESYASDLNPVAVLISKAMIEMPPKFIGKPPINTITRRQPTLLAREWHGVEGLAEDVHYYGKWIRDEAEKRIGHLYPKVEITAEMVRERPDLKPYIGKKLTIIAWLWARTVKSPNPAFSQVDVPLMSTFMLSDKVGKEVYLEPIIENSGYRLLVKVGMPKDPGATRRGTKSGGSGSNFLCLMSGISMPFEYLRSEAKAGRMGVRLTAVVAEGDHGRIYLSPTPDMETIALNAQPVDVPDTTLPDKALGFRIQEYGMKRWSDLFSLRQLATITTFSDLIQDVINQVKRDAVDAFSLTYDDKPLRNGGNGPTAYSEAIAVYLGCALSRLASYNNNFCIWNMKGGSVAQIYSRQAIPMSWEYIEINPLEKMSGNWLGGIEWVSDVLRGFISQQALGYARQLDASNQLLSKGKIISTDPPYYDNIGYADLSDFFYIWLRRSLKSILPELFETVAVPKADELVATPFRHGNKQKAEQFFLSGMIKAMHQLVDLGHPAFPVTIYYAFKQTESDGDDGILNTGWETFLDAVIRAGFAITGTWPMRTERQARINAQDVNSLASSIVLVCRKRSKDMPITTRRDFISELKTQLPIALAHLQHGNIAPVDLAQAAIGPGMAIYTRYDKILDAQGNPLSVRQALSLINQILDEVLAEQEGDFDADTRWALAWFDQLGFADGEYGMAETLSKAKDTAVDGMAEAGILVASRGKVRLLKPSELPKDWDPGTDKRLTTWEIVHHLIRSLESGGESKAAELMDQLGSKAETARELCYRLFTICEHKKRASEALSYNALVQSWPEITRLARETSQRRPTQATFFQG